MQNGGKFGLFKYVYQFVSLSCFGCRLYCQEVDNLPN